MFSMPVTRTVWRREPVEISENSFLQIFVSLMYIRIL
jgi:hypothetical protein